MSSTLPESETIYDVALVGLGPVGATAANLLGKHGYKTVVIEQEGKIYDKPRAIAFDQEVMRIFQSISLTKEILPFTTKYRPALYLGTKGQVIRRIDPSPEPFPLHWLPNYLFNQPGLEKTLRNGIERFNSVDVRLEHHLYSISQDDNYVQLSVRDLQSELEYELSTRYLWACDGAGSPVRRMMTLPQEDLDFDEEWIVIDVRVNDPSTLPEKNIQYCEPGRPSTYVVGPGNHRRWEFMLNPGERPADVATKEHILEMLRRWGDPSNFDIWRSSVYRFHALVAETWSRDRVFLLGDAAHQTPPFMGQGMCQGIRDTANLIWKLNQVERFNAPFTLFEHYEKERKPHVKALTEFTKSLGEIICERDPEKASLRDTRLVQELESGRMVTVRQNLIPNLTDGVLHLEKGEPLGPAGHLFPQPVVVNGSGTKLLLDDILGDGFSMVVRHSEILDQLSDENTEWFKSIGGQITVVSDGMPTEAEITTLNDVLSSFFQTWDCSALLVRPDKYVFGGAADARSVSTLFNNLRPFVS